MNVVYALCLALFVGGSLAFADPVTPSLEALLPLDSPLREDPYVMLYLARYERDVEQLAREREAARLALTEETNWNQLYNVQAVSVEQWDEGRVAARVAEVRAQAADTTREESQILLEIAISRVRVGLEMPICADTH